MTDPAPSRALELVADRAEPAALASEAAFRVLVVDDNPAIHDDFNQSLSDEQTRCRALDELTLSVLGDLPVSAPVSATLGPTFELDFAMQGKEALARVTAARKADAPYALVFMDIRMPPGWDGMESTERITAVDPDVHVVLCTAHINGTAPQRLAALPARDRVLILKKPFDMLEVRQMASVLCEKWVLSRRDKARMAELEHSVSEQQGELAATNAHLRKEIAERALAESQLRKAQRLEGLGRLAAGLCHEINNPLSFIVGNAEILSEDLPEMASYLPQGLRDELAESLAAIDHGANRITKIVRNIKLFARQSEAPMEVITLRDAVDSALTMARLLQREQLELVVEVGEEQVVGRRLELEQVLINLLENASHAMAGVRASRGAHPLRLEIGIDASEDCMIGLYVSDTGPGIEHAVIDNVFDPFFTTKAVDQGTGLGLSICHSLIHGMGGTIDVQSTPGEGARFTVKLPTVGPPPEESAEAAPEPLFRRSATSGKVLVIDDEPFILRTIERSLRRHVVTCVSNVQDALGLCTREEFDVIFCDIMMPGASGCDFHRILAELVPGAEERIVFITGGTRVDSVRRFLEKVPNKCVEKPFETNELRALVDERLGLRAEHT
ncbi:response regulator [Paraliomyxa miuraensis]|uniref:response regulator n=1 Tax=Paraliomyxa miuraensis TaxID=376150 RepID=UPI00224FC78C|nr:response regulator [Paraliomyxa miuraensis]MCX4243914.1 response regulator [Paraliomyxa miuraensis]